MFGGSHYASRLVRVDGYFKSYLPLITQWEQMDINSSKILDILNQHRKIIRNIIDDVFCVRTHVVHFYISKCISIK